jgi:hypothetical protein
MAKQLCAETSGIARATACLRCALAWPSGRDFNRDERALHAREPANCTVASIHPRVRRAGRVPVSCAAAGGTDRRRRRRAGWMRIASENQAFSVSGTQTCATAPTGVAHEVGERRRPVQQRLLRRDDPAPGVVKRATSRSRTRHGPRIASDARGFSVSGNADVRYGVGGSWIAKPVTGGRSVHQRLLRQRPGPRHRQGMRWSRRHDVDRARERVRSA